MVQEGMTTKLYTAGRRSANAGVPISDTSFPPSPHSRPYAGLSLCSSVLASCRSTVSNPSVNQP